MNNRVSGYMEAMNKFGLQEYMYVHYVDIESIYDDVLKILEESGNRKVDAIILPASSLSVSGLKAAKALKLKIPEDVAIVGFEENDLFLVHEPTVTHVYQSISEMGNRAFQMLKAIIEKGEAPSRIVLQPVLTEGGSSRPKIDMKHDDEEFPLFNLGKGNSILVSGSMFSEKGGWTTDSQYIDQMGSTYLLAHGLGTPVADAMTDIDVPVSGEYNMFVRTRNWTAPFTTAPTPGLVKVLIDGRETEFVFGNGSPEWQWQRGGSVFLTKGMH